MKIFLHLFRVLCISLLLFQVILFNSCSEDDSGKSIIEEPPIDEPLLTVSVPTGSIDPQQDVWFFLTDEEGSLIGIQEAVDGLDITFEKPEGFTDEKFNVHQVIYKLAEDESYADFDIKSYSSVSGGQIQLQVPSEASGTVVGEHYFNVSDLPSGYSPTAVGHIAGAGFNGTNGNFTGSSTLLQNNTPLMYWCKNYTDHSQVPRYIFIGDAAAGESVTTTFNDLTPASEMVFWYGGTSIDRTEFRVGPHFTEDVYAGSFEYFSENNTTLSKLFYPANVFNSYDAWIRLTDGDLGRVSHTRGAIPNTIKELQATINSLEVESEKITVSTSGAFDYLYVYGFTEWLTGTQEHWMTWYVYMDDTAEKTFTVPAFPDVITERYPELLTSSKNFYYVLVNDSDNISGYEEFLQNTWHSASFPEFTESLSRSRKFNNIGGRLAPEPNVRTRDKK